MPAPHAAGDPGFPAWTNSVDTTLGGLSSTYAPIVTQAIGVQAYNNATQTVTGGGAAFVAFQAEEWDSHAFHDLTVNNSRLTIPTGKGGKYLVAAKIGFLTGTVPGSCSLNIYKNGVIVVVIDTAPITDQGVMRGSFTMMLAAGDYIELSIYVSTTSTLRALDAGVACYFSAVYLGA